MNIGLSLVPPATEGPPPDGETERRRPCSIFTSSRDGHNAPPGFDPAPGVSSGFLSEG
jgi:hypothetical protein